ncbi:MAG: cell division protein FtsZ [Alphaproteobacteria bacterium]|nr:cell division protein FtsZ [Alphaproteobacteria bacterium]
MSINLAVADTPITQLKPRISVIGVGGGGGNAVNNMIAKNLEGVDFIVANTDSQALAHSTASRKIQLGLEITRGLGAGARPEVGKMAAEEAQSEIERELEGSNMVFITAGMGGGTGSGAAPVVAKIAKQKGILTVGVVTKPFAFEGKKRMETADEAVEKFIKEVDSIIIIPNQNLFRIADKNTTLADAFIMADNVLYSGVRSITDLMMMPGLINLDFADIKSIMEDKGKAIMGTGEAEGENRARIAAEQALSNPLLDDCSMKGAKGVLINITGGNDITLLEIDEAANIIKEEVDEDANIIFGSSFDNSLDGKIRVSIVVTGIEGRPGSRRQEKEASTASYIEESYAPSKEDSNFAIDSQDIDYNLERFSANSAANEDVADNNADAQSEEAIESVEAAEPLEDNAQDENLTQEPLLAHQEAQIVQEPEESNDFEDFDELEKSQSIPEMPQASSLFNAIINKTGTSEHFDDTEKSIEDFLPEEKDIFSPQTTINNLDDDLMLFPEQSEPVFVQESQEPAPEEIVPETPSKTKFIDKILGISRARKNRKESTLARGVSVQNEAPRFSNEAGQTDFSNEDFENLDIPSFLRRK